MVPSIIHSGTSLRRARFRPPLSTPTPQPALASGTECAGTPFCRFDVAAMSYIAIAPLSTFFCGGGDKSDDMAFETGTMRTASGTTGRYRRTRVGGRGALMPPSPFQGTQDDKKSLIRKSARYVRNFIYGYSSDSLSSVLAIRKPTLVRRVSKERTSRYAERTCHSGCEKPPPRAMWSRHPRVSKNDDDSLLSLW